VKPSTCHAEEADERKSKQARPIAMVSEERHEEKECRDVTKSYKGKASN
tara:strand:- start:372 stop:518 length:147 start_codon:yes stop_codon:yes gene_type:complete